MRSIPKSTRRLSRRRVLLSSCLAGALALAVTSTLTAAAPAGSEVIRTRLYPIFAVPGYGSIWVGAHHGVVVYRINPATNKIVKTVSIHATSCGQPAVGAGSVFVPDCIDEGGETLQIDAMTNKVVRKLPGGGPVFGYGSVWIPNHAGKAVLRIDPRSGVVLARISVMVSGVAGESCLGVAGGGSLWIGSDGDKTVTRIDTATNTVTAVIPLAGAASGTSPGQGYAGGCEMAYAGGKAWYGNPAGIFEIDAATNTATLLPIRIGNLAKWGDIVMTAGAGSVWARTSGDSVTRIDPATGNVIRTYPATGGGGGMSVAYNSLWIANAGADSTWREPLG